MSCGYVRSRDGLGLCVLVAMSLQQQVHVLLIQYADVRSHSRACLRFSPLRIIPHQSACISPSHPNQPVEISLLRSV